MAIWALFYSILVREILYLVCKLTKECLTRTGGPGGSGVETILSLGEQFRSVLGDNYDLVGFDPRGEYAQIENTPKE